MDIFPKYLNKQYVSAEMPVGNEHTKLYNVHEPNFAKLGDKQLIQDMLPELIKIPIHQELNAMTSEHQLEISVPMLGLTDLLKNDAMHIADLQFAAPVFINGFGAGNSVAHPDFILATDIVGNQFEILVSGDGLIEIPAEGFGLFSVLSYLTFIYSEWQIKQGNGLENMVADGIEPGYLYLLPPLAEKSFIPKIALTHLDENNMRKVDTLHSVEVEMKAPDKHFDLSSDIHALDGRNDAFEVLMNIKNQSLSSPFSVKFTLMNAEGVHFSLQSPSNPFQSLSSQGWQQSAVEDNTFVKHFGLNDETKTVILRNIYSELDFTKDFLSGDTFGLSTAKNYNSFMLYPEGLGKIYDLVTDGIVHNHISSDFLWNRVSESNFADLDLQHIPLAFHDSVILSDILSDKHIDTTEAIKQFFGDHSHQVISESLSVYASKAEVALPTLSVEILEPNSHDNMGGGSVSFVNVHDNIDQVLSQPLSHYDSQPSDGLSFLHTSDAHLGTGFDLHFSDIIQSADNGSLSALTSPPQDLTALLNTAEASYTSETLHFTDVHYSTPNVNVMSELHMAFTQNPVDGS